MKRFITLGIIFCFSLSGFTQKINKTYDDAQKLYKKMAFSEALPLYKKALETDTSSLLIKEKIAHCYRKLQNSEQAEIWYAKVVQSPLTDPEDKLYYAQALASNNKHQDAQLWYNAYAKQVKDDSRPMAFSLAYQNLESFYKDSLTFQINVAPFNSPEDDFSPAFFGKKIVFVSNRHNQPERFKWDGSSFLDLYVYESGKVKPFQERLNTPYHEGPLAFFPKGDSVIFTRNSLKKGNKGEKINRLNLYIAYKQPDGTWGKEKEFVHNSQEFSTMHPALSLNGKTLYFVSDRVGSLGGMDIWVSYLENNQWTSPQNLGENINTRGNEAFPFVDGRGSLYFASNGHSGLGGLDIFMAENVENKFITPFNLGYPVNSVKDDFGFIFNTKTKKGYFSSNRAGGIGKDDIYEIIVKRNLNNFSELILTTRNDDTEAIIPSTEVQIKSDQKTTLNFSDANGNIKYYFNKKFHYEITAKKEGYELKHMTFIPEQIASHPEDDTLEIDLVPEKKAITIIKFLDEITNQPIEVNILILEKNTQKMIASWQAEGKWEKPLEKGIYEIRATAKGYIYQVDTIQVMDKDAKTQKNIYLKALKKQTVFSTNVLYEKHEYKPNKKSVSELENLQKLLEDNPKLSIKIIGYSQDSKQEVVNKNLAEKRAKFIQDYLVSKKIVKKRMVVSGATSKKSSIEIEILDTEDNPNENQEQPIKSIFDE
ncbi:MAG: OmpA family protein [Raineya sp.]|jgi:outer membrane protein OmpA-like peptidoglycan-associated protein|nr:OmpA family protein [Raineya sp.]